MDSNEYKNYTKAETKTYNHYKLNPANRSREVIQDMNLFKKGRNKPLTGKEPPMLLDLRNRVLSDAAAFRKGNMLLLNLFEEKSKIFKFVNLLKLL